MNDVYGIAITGLLMIILFVAVIIVNFLRDLIDVTKSKEIETFMKSEPGLKSEAKCFDTASMHPDSIVADKTFGSDYLPINYQQSLISIDAAVNSNEKRIDALENEVNRLREYIKEHAIQLKQHEEKLNEIYIEE